LTGGLLALALTKFLGGNLALFARHDPTLDQALPAKEGS